MKKQKKYYSILLGILIITLMLPKLSLGAELQDPLKGRDVTTLVADIIQYVLGFVGVIALVMFIYGGILWMTSGGSQDRIKKGKDTLVWAVLGLAFIFFSYAVLDFVFKAFLTN